MTNKLGIPNAEKTDGALTRSNSHTSGKIERPRQTKTQDRTTTRTKQQRERNKQRPLLENVRPAAERSRVLPRGRPPAGGYPPGAPSPSNNEDEGEPS